MNKLGQKYVNPDRQALADQKEKLRAAKKKWNKSVKEFIPELIKFKQLMNGRVEGKDRVKLYDPFPEESLSKIDSLTENFKSETELAKQIIDYQNDYSKKYNNFYSSLEDKRKEKLKKTQASLDDYNLLSEGIGPIGLAWESVKSFFGDTAESRRVSLLRQFFDVDQACAEAQIQILNTRSPEDLEKAKAKIFNSLNVFKSIKYSLTIAKNRASEMLSAPTEEKGKGKPKKENSFLGNLNIIDTISKDLENLPYYEANPANKIPENFHTKRIDLYKALERAKHSKHSRAIDIAERKYNELIDLCFPAKDHKSFFSYRELKQTRNREAGANKYDYLIKYAENRPYDSISQKIKKFLSRIGLKFHVFFKIKGNLESSSADLQEVRNNNAEVMSLLNTKDIDNEGLIRLIDQNVKILGEVREELDSCRDIINKEGVKPEQLEAVNKSIEKSWFKKMLSRNK